MASKEIQLKVIADAKGFQKEIMKIPGMTEKSAASAALRMSKEMHKGFQKVGKDAEKSGKKIGGALTVAIGSALAEIGLRMAQAFDPSQIVEMMHAAADATNQINDLATETGLSASQLATLQLKAAATGKELGNIEGAIRPLAKKLGDFRLGTGEAKVGLDQLGITVDDLTGPRGGLIPMSEAFDLITTRMMAVENEAKRADIAIRIFGEGGGHLLGTLSALGGEMESVAALNKSLGINSQEAATAAAEFQVALALNKQMMTAISTVILVEFAPAFEASVHLMNHGVALATAYSKAIGFSLTPALQGAAAAMRGDYLQAAKLVGESALKATVDVEKLAGALLVEELKKAADRSQIITSAFDAIGKAGKAASGSVEDLADNVGDVEVVFKDATGLIKSEAIPAIVKFRTDIEGLSEEIIFGETTLSDWNDAIDEGRDRLAGASLLTNMYADIAGQAFDMASAKTSQHRDTLTSLREEYQTLNDELQAVNDKEIERLEFHSERTELTDEMRKKIKDLANDERSAIEDQMALNKERRRQERQALRDKAQLARKMFRMQKAAAVGQTLINSGEASLAVAAQFPPPNPLFAVGLGLVAGQLAMSLAQIKAQKAPSFHSGGMIQADERMIRARRGEAVLNERATQRLGEATITGLNEGRMMAPITVNVQVGRRQLERVVIDAMNRQAVEAVGTINPYAAR
jgi:hypothetical protein